MADVDAGKECSVLVIDAKAICLKKVVEK